MLYKGFKLVVKTVLSVIFFPIFVIGYWSERGIPRFLTNRQIDWFVFITGIGFTLLGLLCWSFWVLITYYKFFV